MTGLAEYKTVFDPALRSGNLEQVLGVVQQIKNDCQVYIECREGRRIPQHRFQILNHYEFVQLLVQYGKTPSPRIKGIRFQKGQSIDIAIDFETLMNVPNDSDKTTTIVVNTVLVIMEELIHAIRPDLNEKQVNELNFQYVSDFLPYSFPREFVEKSRKAVMNL